MSGKGESASEAHLLRAKAGVEGLNNRIGPLNQIVHCMRPAVCEHKHCRLPQREDRFRKRRLPSKYTVRD